jgi:hypothetical protein
MGLNNDNARRLVFDIETVPREDAGDFLEPAEAPANYRDPVKIAAVIAEKNAENLARCALDADLCRIVAIGYSEEGRPPQATILLRDMPEADMLNQFWNAAKDRHLVGFNCVAFDLPALLRRSLCLRVPAPPLQVERNRHPQVTDLMQEMSFKGLIRTRSLTFYAKLLGFDVPDKLTGADIAQAVTDERWDDINAHLMSDVLKTESLAEVNGHFTRDTTGNITSEVGVGCRHPADWRSRDTGHCGLCFAQAFTIEKEQAQWVLGSRA